MTVDSASEAARPERLTRSAIVELVRLAEELEGVPDFADVSAAHFDHLWISPRRSSSRMSVLLAAAPWDEERRAEDLDALEDDFVQQFGLARAELCSAWGEAEDLPPSGATILGSQWAGDALSRRLLLTSEMHEMPYFLQVELELA